MPTANPARTFDRQVTADETDTLPISGTPALAVYVQNNDGGGNDLLVNVPEVHGSDWDVVKDGDTGEYFAMSEGIVELNVKARGSATPNYLAGVKVGSA